MKKVYLLVIALFIAASSFAQTPNEILLKVGNEEISKTEFLRTYQKNNSLSSINERELREYLDLFTTFKLKVIEGIAEKIDTSEMFQYELAQYKSQSAQQYLVDKEVTDQLIKEAIYRSKRLVRAAHILIMCSKDAPPKDTLIAYNKILDIRKKIVAGTVTFYDAAVKYSEDPSARDEVNPQNGRVQNGNKGELGYFSAFDLIYPFESAAFTTRVGGYSTPIRTQFGYHLIWVQDNREMVSKIAISQIFVPDTAARFGRISPAAQEKMNTIKQGLAQGKDFATIAGEHNDDPMSKMNGGLVEPFAPNRRPGDFVHRCLTLKPAEISEPFSSVIGWHIVQLKELIVPEINDDELRYSIIPKIQRDSRSHKSQESLLKKLKKEYLFADKGKTAAFKLLATNLEGIEKLSSSETLLEIEGLNKLKPMATFADITITVFDFIEYLNSGAGMNIPSQPQSFLSARFDVMIEDMLMKFETENLENKYSEYKELIAEYHQGMILFELNNNKIWSESLKDSAALEQYYQKIKFDYLDSNGAPKPYSEIRATVISLYQNELDRIWVLQLKEKYPVWVNEELLKTLYK